jgi:hypothetical protein
MPIPALATDQTASAPYHLSVDFDWSPEHIALRTKARAVAQDAVARYGRFNDTWMNGYSKEFSK